MCTGSANSTASIFIASQRGDSHASVVSPLREASQKIGSVLTSDSEDARPERTDAVVVVDGWGSVSLLRTAEHCQRRFGSPVLLAILNESSSTVAEVLDSGFDSCARWPVPPVELAAWLRAALRRSRGVHHAPEIVLDPLNLGVRCHELEATLTRGQFSVLNELLSRPSGWITGKALLAATSGGYGHDTTQIRNHILALRRKLGPEAWRIRWHRSLGYSFDASHSAPVAPVVSMRHKKE